jgi:hypothetical protein
MVGQDRLTKGLPFSRKQRGETLDRYLTQSHVTLERHVRRKQLKLAQFISSRTKIYLDTNFWIWLRKAASGSGTEQSVHLLSELRRVVASGAAICPLSDGAILELFKQSDPHTRRSTGVLMDELSLGITLIEPQMRIGTEISHLIHDKSGRGPLDDLDDLVWCKVAYALGYVHPITDWIEPNVMLAIQKGTFDETWEMTLCHMIEALGDSPMPAYLDFDTLAEELNAGNEAHAHELRSFSQAYRAEVRGIVDLTGHLVPEIIHSIGQKEGVIPPDAPFIPDQANLNFSKNLLATILEKNKARRELRSVHIQASLHASHRWDKGRKFDSHDLIDFAHATAALGYCDAFFTELPLKTMLEQKHIDLASLYDRTVCASMREATDFVAGLEARRVDTNSCQNLGDPTV